MGCRLETVRVGRMRCCSGSEWDEGRERRVENERKIERTKK